MLVIWWKKCKFKFIEGELVKRGVMSLLLELDNIFFCGKGRLLRES